MGLGLGNGQGGFATAPTVQLRTVQRVYSPPPPAPPSNPKGGSLLRQIAGFFQSHPIWKITAAVAGMVGLAATAYGLATDRSPAILENTEALKAMIQEQRQLIEALKAQIAELTATIEAAGKPAAETGLGWIAVAVAGVAVLAFLFGRKAKG